MKLVKSLLGHDIQSNLSGTVQYLIDTKQGVIVSEDDAAAIMEKLGGNVSIVDAPVVDAPVVDAPVVDAPVVDAPVVDAPVVDAPVVDAPVVDAQEKTLSVGSISKKGKKA